MEPGAGVVPGFAAIAVGEHHNKGHPIMSGSYTAFRAGDWVEVKSVEEILATLDDRGRLDALPFLSLIHI